MADVTISGLPTELASAGVDGDVDWMEIDDVSAVETKKVHPRALLIGLTGASVGAVGKDILTQGGVGGVGDGGNPGGDGGDGIVDAGPGGADGGAGAGTAGIVSLGETNASAIQSGVGPTSLWTHAGIMKVLAAIQASAGTIGAPGASFTADLGVGLRLPAAKQLGLVAFNEEVVVDNTAATPVFRPDVDNTWDCGNATFAWQVMACYTAQILTRVLAPTGSVGSPSIDIGGRGGLFSPAADQVALAANSEAIIVDNDSATPSLRGDVAATWDLGEDAIGFLNAFVGSYKIPGDSNTMLTSGGAGVLNLRTSYAGGDETVYAGRYGLVNDAEVAHLFSCEVDQSAAEGYTGLKVSVKETALGSGTKNLLQVLAGAAGATERMRLNNAGALVLPAAGAVGAPTLIVGVGLAGLFEPAADQLGLAANSKAIIVDNDSATPSLRPDADDDWTLGEAALRYADVFATQITIGDMTMKDPRGGDAHWKIIEGADGICAYNIRTGQKYSIPLRTEPMSDSDHELIRAERARWEK